jgi:hypothetical protein
MTAAVAAGLPRAARPYRRRLAPGRPRRTRMRSSTSSGMPEDDPDQAKPGREALRSFPPGVRAKMAAVLTAVAAAPPHRFAGGGYWEAMHGEMTGY